MFNWLRKRLQQKETQPSSPTSLTTPKTVELPKIRKHHKTTYSKAYRRQIKREEGKIELVQIEEALKSAPIGSVERRKLLSRRWEIKNRSKRRVLNRRAHKKHIAKQEEKINEKKARLAQQKKNHYMKNRQFYLDYHRAVRAAQKSGQKLSMSDFRKTYNKPTISEHPELITIEPSKPIVPPTGGEPNVDEYDKIYVESGENKMFVQKIPEVIQNPIVVVEETTVTSPESIVSETTDQEIKGVSGYNPCSQCTSGQHDNCKHGLCGCGCTITPQVEH